MKLLTISIILAGALAMARKIYLHFKLLDPQQRNLIQLGKYLGVDFLLPVFTRYNSRHLRNRKDQANRMLVIFYACCIITAFLILMRYTD
jgi:hypothetical protein